MIENNNSVNESRRKVSLSILLWMSFSFVALLMYNLYSLSNNSFDTTTDDIISMHKEFDDLKRQLNILLSQQDNIAQLQTNYSVKIGALNNKLTENELSVMKIKEMYQDTSKNEKLNEVKLKIEEIQLLHNGIMDHFNSLKHKYSSNDDRKYSCEENEKQNKLEEIKSENLDILEQKLFLFEELSNSKLEYLLAEHAKSIEDLQQSHEASMAKKDVELEELKVEHAKSIEDLQQSHEVSMAKKDVELEELKVEHAKSIEDLQQSHEASMAKKDVELEELKVEHAKSIEDLQQSHEASIAKKDVELEELKVEHAKSIEDLQQSHEVSMAKKDVELEELKVEHAKSIEDLQQSHEASMAKKDVELEELKVEHAKSIEDLQQSHEASMAVELEELKVEHAKSIEDLQQSHEASMAKKDVELEELKVEHAKSIEDLQQSHEASIAKKDIELEELKVEHAKSIEDLQQSHEASIAKKDVELEELKVEHAKSIEDLQQSHEASIAKKDVELEELKVEHAKSIEDLQQSHEASIAKKQSEFDEFRADRLKSFDEKDLKLEELRSEITNVLDQKQLVIEKLSLKEMELDDLRISSLKSIEMKNTTIDNLILLHQNHLVEVSSEYDEKLNVVLSETKYIYEQQIQSLINAYDEKLNISSREIDDYKQQVENYRREHEHLTSTCPPLIQSKESKDNSNSNQIHLLNDVIKNEVTIRKDFALKEAGGKIVIHLTSSTYSEHIDSAPKIVENFKPFAYVYSFLENKINTPLQNPEKAISDIISPGECWTMAGSYGKLTIELKVPIVITSISIDHLNPSQVKDRTTALKDFEVYGFNGDVSLYELSNFTAHEESILLLKDTFIMTGQGSYDNVQSFTVEGHEAESFKFVTLNILNNHGNPAVTCLYRLRVYGFPIV